MRLRRVRRLFQQGLNAFPRTVRTNVRRAVPQRPAVEALEDRTLMTVSLVADLNTAPQSSRPSTFVETDGKMFFFAYDPAHGRELWTTDGTATGTHLVKDIWPGPRDAQFPIDEDVMAGINGDAYFWAGDPVNGRQLWKSDGTAAGTAPVLGLPTTVSFDLRSFDGALYFQAPDSAGAFQLWRSDGTAAGTVQLTNTGSPGVGLNAARLTMADLGGTVYFLSSSGVLWTTDGTAVGTSQVTVFSGGASNLVSVGGSLYLQANDGTDSGLWKSDGTAAGTTFVVGLAGFGAGNMTDFNGTLVFTAPDTEHSAQLWRSDGTAAGTAMITSINPGGQDFNQLPFGLTVAGGRLYFVEGSDPHLDDVDLWVTDGTAAGTTMLRAFDNLDAPRSVMNVGTTVYFSTDQGLWSTDGTVAGTTMLHAAGIMLAFPGPFQHTQPPNPGFEQGIGNLVDFDGTLLFAGTDPDTGVELWRSDGTAAGTVIVKDINPGTQDSFFDGLAAFNGRLVFQTFTPLDPAHPDDGASDYSLWATDGTAAGTVLLQDYGEDSLANLSSTAVVGGLFYFVAPDAAGDANALWETDGTAAGTQMVMAFDLGENGVTSLTAFDGALYFVASDGPDGYELWRSDGTAAGTTMVKDIDPDGDSSPTDLTVAGGTLYFVADDGSDGPQLWESDGTEAGTTQVAVISPDGVAPHDLTAVGSTLYFGANDGINGDQLWKSDGTAAGTTMVAAINPSGDAFPTNLVNAGGMLFFTADDGTNGRQLWTSDGTAAGTALVTITNPDGDSEVQNLSAVNGKLFFVATDGTDGDQVWTSDGTAAGTVMVTPSSLQFLDPPTVVDAGGVGYFAGFTQSAGWQLWATDGSVVGTQSVKLLAASFNPAGLAFEKLEPTNFTAADGVLYFTAGDLVHGTELWKAVAPEAALSGNADGVPFQQRSYTLGASEPTVGDPGAVYTYAVDWGDGTTGTFTGPAGTAATHAFTAAGTYTVTLRATDADGIAGLPVTESVTIEQAEIQGDTLAVGGTTGGDAFVVTPGATAGSVDVTLNGVDLGTFTPPGGTVTIYGGPASESLTVNGTAAADAFTLGVGTVTVNGLAVSYSSVQAVAVNGLAGNDTFTMADPSAAVSVNGGGGSDTLVGPNQSTTWNITGTSAGQVGGVSFAAIPNLQGGSGDDTFAFANGASVAGTVDGGGGVNTLDYSAYTTSVTVNLLLGTATGTAGLQNVVNVTGGSGNDLLAGNWQANVLHGGAGRDVLIGGLGADTLDGGSGDDLLIAGFTLYDASAPALAAVLGYWGRTDLSFSARVAGLSAGISYTAGGSSHTVRLTQNTVVNDFAADTLTGGAGADWFFAYLGVGTADLITDLTAADFVTRLRLI